MNFFVDRCVPQRLARVLDVFDDENTIQHLDDDSRFTDQTPDVEWLAKLAEDTPPWHVITNDWRILRNEVEKAALDKAGLKFFVLNKAWVHMPFHELTWKFIKAWPNVVAKAKNDRRKVFEIQAGASLKVEALEVS